MTSRPPTARRPALRAAALLSLAVPVALAPTMLGCVMHRGGTAYAGGRQAAPGGWMSVTIAPNVTVAMPRPQPLGQHVDRLPDGSQATARTWGAQFWGGATYLVAVADFEGGVAVSPFELLDSMFDDFNEDENGMDIVSSEGTWRAGHPGTVLTMRGRDGRHRVVHQYVGRSRAYTFVFESQRYDPSYFGPSEQQFFTSIQLDRADGPSPSGDGAFGSFQWIDPPEAGFAVEIAGTPTRVDSTAMIGGEEVQVYTYATRTSDGAQGMSARAIELPGDRTPDDLMVVLQQLGLQPDETVSGLRPTQRQGYGGQAFVAESAGASRFVLQIVADGYVVELSHRVPRGQESAHAESRRRFFNSLRLL